MTTLLEYIQQYARMQANGMKLGFELSKWTLFDPEKLKMIDIAHKSSQDLWVSALQQALNKEFIIKKVDPAIKNIIEGLLALGGISFDSCSGHPDDWNPYLEFMFIDQDDYTSFVSFLKRIMDSRRIGYCFEGYQLRLIGFLGPKIPERETVRQLLPITIRGQTHSQSECIRFWEVFNDLIYLWTGQPQQELQLNLFSQKNSELLSEEESMMQLLVS